MPPTAYLKLLRQISTVRLLLKKRHSYLSKISWPIVYWVIKIKDISVKMSFTLVQSVISRVDISTATKQCDFVSRWLPIVTTSTIWILVNQILL